MRALAVLIALTILVPGTALGQSKYDRHIVFDNSATDKSHYYSQGSFVTPSELELVDRKFPVEESRCQTPPNCLRLSGDPELAVTGRSLSTSENTIAMLTFRAARCPCHATPRLILLLTNHRASFLSDVNGEGTPSIRFIGALQKATSSKMGSSYIAL